MKKCLCGFKFIAILTHLLVKQATRAIRSFEKSESVIRYFLSKNELFTRKTTEQIPNPEKIVYLLFHSLFIQNYDSFFHIHLFSITVL